MKEHEVKILDVDEKQIIKKLEKLGAILIFDGEMNSSYYDLKNNVLRNSGKMLRIRKKGKKTILTLKLPKESEEMQINSEYEVEVSDFDTMQKILSQLELNEFAKDFRHRKSYRLNGATVEINKYPDIPVFLELEAHSPKKLKEIVALLGHSMGNTKPWSGKDVLNYYGKQTELG